MKRTPLRQANDLLAQAWQEANGDTVKARQIAATWKAIEKLVEAEEGTSADEQAA